MKILEQLHLFFNRTLARKEIRHTRFLLPGYIKSQGGDLPSFRFWHSHASYTHSTSYKFCFVFPWANGKDFNILSNSRVLARFQSLTCVLRVEMMHTSREYVNGSHRPWGPFLERPGNFSGP